jgi:hypothetical protein
MAGAFLGSGLGYVSLALFTSGLSYLFHS